MSKNTNPYDLRQARRALDAAPSIEAKIKSLSDEVKTFAGRLKALEKAMERVSKCLKA